MQLQLQNFLGLLFGIRGEYLQIENDINIIDYTIKDENIFLNFSKNKKTILSFNKIHNELWELSRDASIKILNVYCFDIDTKETHSIDTIERISDFIILGLAIDYNEDNKTPDKTWFYSKNSHIIRYNEDNFNISIDKSKNGGTVSCYSVFVRDTNNNNDNNKLKYFMSINAILNRFNFKVYNVTIPPKYLIELL